MVVRYARRMRAFSLIEVMVSVAIVGIVAALAVPSLLPEIHKAQLEGATESAANVFARARMEAMLAKRCTRIRLVDPRTLIAEVLNSFDCESPANNKRVDTSLALWLEIDTLRPESPSVTFTFAVGSGGQLPAHPGGEVRFRPNGRVYSGDGTASAPTLDLTNDDGIFVVQHTKLSLASTTRKILIDGTGLICALPRGVTPPVVAGTNYRCP